ncbi:redoxin domain-containing protein [Pedobacter sp. FW305-3-2-15-E-R2A2]|uniref:TlpA family protein disulfide reductase n=1 Tax=Pedobacter sp. FW305-3-2-15-E-R2A2 TaxID=3140251 RepID=UPI003140AFCC
MKLLKITAILFYLVLSTVVYAQQKTKTEFSRRPDPDPKIRNIKVGDRVPDIIIPKIIRDTKSSAKISDFKDKLLIIDFWDTFCGSCIEALPKMDSLQSKFGSRIKILPVSYQSEEVMTKFFKNNGFVKNVKLPCVVEDKALGSYFQYKLISHEIWIYKGIVVAITGADYVTEKNIQTILDEKKVNWPIKNDMVIFDPKKPLFVQTDADQYNTKSLFLHYSGITGHRNGIDYKGGLTETYDSIGRVYRSTFYNYTIVGAFNYITYLIKPRNFVPHKDRLILEVKDRSRYVYDKSYGFRSDWNQENEFCYELCTTRPIEKKAKFQYILDDLNHILGVNARWEKRPVKCLILIKTKEISNLDSINLSRKVINGYNTEMSGIPLLFLDQAEIYPPGIDETGFKGNVRIGAFKNIQGLREQLQVYGCDVIETERNIDVLVITEL